MSRSTEFPSLPVQEDEFLLRHRPKQEAMTENFLLHVDSPAPQVLHLTGVEAAVAGEWKTAAEYLLKAIAHEDGRADWHADLAVVYFASDHTLKAGVSALKAVKLDAGSAVAHDILARIASQQGRDHRACVHLRLLAALTPARPRLRSRLALAEFAVGNITQVIGLIEQDICGGTAEQALHSEYLAALLYDPNQTRESIRCGSERWAQSCQIGRENRPLRKNFKRDGERMRIGYLCSEFMASPSRHFLLPILRRHDRKSFELTFYHARNREDKHTVQFRNVCDRWRSCAELSDEELAALIEADEIDILVDLSGHHRHNRLAIFKLRPAPIQIAFPDYPATTGLSEMDAIFSDKWVCPEGFESQYTENIYRLSSGYLAYEPPPEAPAVKRLPLDHGDGPVLGLFQWAGKRNSNVWDSVAEILKALHNSRLMVHDSSVELDEPGSPARQFIELQLTVRGVSSSRVVYRGYRPLAAHLDLLGDADIALDTFPFNGATTTCECLWMGVPVVTMLGGTHAGRVGFEVLDRVGLGRFVAMNSKQYVEKAVDLIRDVDQLRQLRFGLREQMLRSTLLNPEPSVREIESAYRYMWQTFLKENR